MSKLSKLNSNSINGLINIDCDTINTSLISNDEINTLNNSTITTTLQEQIDTINNSTITTNLQDQINTLNNSVITDESQIALINTQLSTINTQISDINDDIETNNDDIYTSSITLENQINLYPFLINNNLITYFKISNIGDVYMSNLYINDSYIDFTSFITSESLVTSLLIYSKIDSPIFTGIPMAPTALTTIVTDQIATCKYVQNYMNANYQDYVTGSVLGGVMSDYFKKEDVDNEISIYTSQTLSDAKSYTDSQIATVNTAIAGTVALTAVNTAAIAGCIGTEAILAGEIATIQAQIGVIDGTLGTHTAEIGAINTELDGVIVDIEALQGDVGTIQTDVGNIQEKVFYQTSGGDVNGNFTRFNSNLYINNGITDIIKLKNTGEILSTTITASTGNLDTISGCINAGITNGHISFIDNCNTATITTLNSTTGTITTLNSTTGNINTITSSTANINKLVFTSGLSSSLITNSSPSMVITSTNLNIIGSLSVNGIPYIPFSITTGFNQWV